MKRSSGETFARAVKAAAAGAVLFAAYDSGAAADGLPGMRGHDHTGITVPDMGQAITFFTDVLGCQKVMSFGPFSDDKGTFMKDALGVHPRAVITQITLIRCGFGSNIELFSYQSPDQQVVQPKNSDIGGYHIALYVDDIRAADSYLRGKGVFTFFGPVPVNEGPAAGQAISISRRRGAFSLRRSPIPTEWPTRRLRKPSYGRRKTRRSSIREVSHQRSRPQDCGRRPRNWTEPAFHAPPHRG